jgi:hypothetical protein
VLQGQAHSVHLISSRFFSSLVTHCAHTSRTSNDRALCCMQNHGITLVQLLHCLLSSFCQLESTPPPATQLLLSQSQQGDLVGHHLLLSNVLERISLLSCEPLYATNTSRRIEEIFLDEYPLHWVLPIKKLATKFSFKVLYSSSTVAILTIKPASEYAHAHFLPRLSLSWTVLLYSDTKRKNLRELQLFYF